MARASYPRPEATCPLCGTLAARSEIDNERERDRGGERKEKAAKRRRPEH